MKKKPGGSTRVSFSILRTPYRSHSNSIAFLCFLFICFCPSCLLALLCPTPASASTACTSERDYKDAAAVAKAIGIELVRSSAARLPFPPHAAIHASHSFFRVDFVKQYWNSVFATFIQQYAAGLTPNPDVLCNRHVKFGHLLEHARSLGASRLATGHYARVASHGAATAGTVSLLRPSDMFKDQTYFLCQV
jgi:tRNA-specific 2-thiouridylase